MKPRGRYICTVCGAIIHPKSRGKHFRNHVFDAACTVGIVLSIIAVIGYVFG